MSAMPGTSDHRPPSPPDSPDRIATAPRGALHQEPAWRQHPSACGTPRILALLRQQLLESHNRTLTISLCQTPQEGHVERSGGSNQRRMGISKILRATGK